MGWMLGSPLLNKHTKACRALTVLRCRRCAEAPPCAVRPMPPGSVLPDRALLKSTLATMVAKHRQAYACRFLPFDTLRSVAPRSTGVVPTRRNCRPVALGGPVPQGRCGIIAAEVSGSFGSFRVLVPAVPFLSTLEYPQCTGYQGSSARKCPEASEFGAHDPPALGSA